VAVVIVNYNGRDDTLACIDSLWSSEPDPAMEIFVVDNASTDGSVEALQAMDGIRLLQMGCNAGVARANREGMRVALEEEFDYILLLNNDVVVEPTMTRRLWEAMRADPSIGICAPKMYFHEPSDLLWSVGGKINRWWGDTSHIGDREVDRGQFDRVCEVDYVPTAAALIRREVFQAGLDYDNSFFVYFDDTSLCYQTQRKGWKVVVEPRAKMWHKVSASVGPLTPFRWYHYAWGRTRFVMRVLEPRYRWAAGLLFAGLGVPRLLVFFARRRSLDCFRAYLAGVLDGVLELGKGPQDNLWRRAPPATRPRPNA
jgi:GT2 family glycosyltransferase